jgi:hypothetical protein
MSASRSCRCFVEKRGDVFGLGLRIAFRDIPDVRAIVTTEIVDMSVLAQSGQPTKVCGLTRRTFRMRHRREGIRIVGHCGFLVRASLKSRCNGMYTVRHVGIYCASRSGVTCSGPASGLSFGTFHTWPQSPQR